MATRLGYFVMQKSRSLVLGVVVILVCGVTLLFVSMAAGTEASLHTMPAAFPPPDGAGSATSKEAYVIFLPSMGRTDYVNCARTLLYGYKHDPDTRDVDRDVVVLTTPQVSIEFENQLRSEGAIVARHDLIRSIPSPWALDGDIRWKDVYNKLLIWNMTEYERVLMTDADFMIGRPMMGIWDIPEARPASGLAAGYNPESCLNAGFMIAVPNRTTFEELLLVRDFDAPMGDIEQGLLNKYFHRDGPRPWVSVDKPEKIWIATVPTKEELERGVRMFHEKLWQDDIEVALTNLWRTNFGKMSGYWKAKNEMINGGYIWSE